jgi:hypothetical protein
MNVAWNHKGKSHFFTERNRYQRCGKCQFFATLLLIITISLFVFLLLSVFPSFINQDKFQILSASSLQQQNNIVIDANLKINFSEDVIEALENGIPLTIAVNLQVIRERFWWKNVLIKESIQLFELRYHPLTDIHEVKNIATNDRYTFNSRQEAMMALGTIRGAHLITNTQLNSEQNYFVQMRIWLDINRLPIALRPLASLSSAWRLESPWFHWPIQSLNAQHVGDLAP